MIGPGGPGPRHSSALTGYEHLGQVAAEGSRCAGTGGRGVAVILALAL